MLGTIILILLAMATLFFYAVGVGITLSEQKSDAAGNAMAMGFGILFLIVMWVLIAIQFIVAASAGLMPIFVVVSGLMLIPAATLAMIRVLDETTAYRPRVGRKFVVVVPPLLVLAFLGTCRIEPIRNAISPGVAAFLVWGPILVLSTIGLHPLFRNRPRVTAEEYAAFTAKREAEEKDRREQSFKSLTPDSPFQEWWNFVESDDGFSKAAFEGARTAKNRQQEIGELLPRGQSRLFKSLSQLDITVTPEIEQGARAYLKANVECLMPYDPAGSNTTKIVVDWYEQFFPTIQWLVDNKARLNEELAAIGEAVKGYPDTPDRQRFLAALDAFKS